MACRKEVVIGVVLAASLWLAGCGQRPATEAESVDAAATLSAIPEPAVTADPTRSAPPAATASSRIFIDPVTGEQRAPTPAEAALAAQSDEARPVGSAAARQKAPVEEVPVPGGFTEVRIGEGAMREEKVCLQPDGNLAACADRH